MDTRKRVIVDDSYSEHEDEGRLDYTIAEILTAPFFNNQATRVKKNQCMYCKRFQRNIMRCGKCDFQRYCSAECQSKDWSIHKGYCKILVENEAKLFRVNPPRRAGDDGANQNQLEMEYLVYITTHSKPGLITPNRN